VNIARGLNDLQVESGCGEKPDNGKPMIGKFERDGTSLFAHIT
jgi:hypothetical protein